MTTHFDQLSHQWDQEQYRHDRAKAIAEQLCKQIHLQSGMKALEFGCGTGLLGFYLLPYFAFLTFADASQGMLEKVRKKIREGRIQNADTLLLDVSSDTLPKQYDCIFSLMTLHHIANYETVIQTLVNHLTPGGFLGIADLEKEDGSFHGHQETIHHGIDREHLKSLFRNCGLTEIHDSTPYIARKQTQNGWKEFPIFLLTGQYPKR